MSYHVYPETDSKPHSLKGSSCNCLPKVETFHPETKAPYKEPLITHKSFSNLTSKWKVEREAINVRDNIL